MKAMTKDELEKKLKSHPEKFIGKLLITNDNWVCKILDIDEERGVLVRPLYRLEDGSPTEMGVAS